MSDIGDSSAKGRCREDTAWIRQFASTI